VLGGGGIRGGTVGGESDARDAYVKDRMVTIGDLFATLCNPRAIRDTCARFFTKTLATDLSHAWSPRDEGCARAALIFKSPHHSCGRVTWLLSTPCETLLQSPQSQPSIRSSSSISEANISAKYILSLAESCEM
jgi:hypothetical protein